MKFDPTHWLVPNRLCWTAATWRAGFDWKEESEGERRRLPLLSLPITLCSRRACYEEDDWGRVSLTPLMWPNSTVPFLAEFPRCQCRNKPKVLMCKIIVNLPQVSLTCFTTIPDNSWWTAAVKAVYLINTSSIVQTRFALAFIHVCNRAVTTS